MSIFDETLRVHKAKFEGLLDTLPEDTAALLRSTLVREPAATWALNWYKTRRHIPKAGVEPSEGGRVRAYCSPYTTIWTQGHGDLESSHYIPPANSPAVLETEACRICAKRAAIIQ